MFGVLHAGQLLDQCWLQLPRVSLSVVLFFYSRALVSQQNIFSSDSLLSLTMGGPCTLQSGATAPACTDNFYVACFNFGGKEWQSCEQCFQVSRHFAAVLLQAPHLTIASQACKSLDSDSEYSKAMRSIQKTPVHLCCHFDRCIEY